MTGTLENLLLSHLQQYCYLPDPATYIISSAIHILFLPWHAPSLVSIQEDTKKKGEHYLPCT